MQAPAPDARRRGDAQTIANVGLNPADVFLAQGDLTLAETARPT
jgi:hypothetical protein